MEQLILQSGIRHGRFAELTRSNNEVLTVGRGYNNDLVITDPHVAPDALRFDYREDHWWLTVLDDTNPVVMAKQAVTGTVKVDSGDKITIGRTPLTVYLEGHPLSATQKLPWGSRLAIAAIHPLFSIGLFLGVLLLTCGLQFWEGATDLKWQTYANENLALGVMILAWSCLWAIVGLIARQQHALWAQLLVTTIVWGTGPALDLLYSYLSYPFHLPMLDGIYTTVYMGCFVFILLFLNLVIATNLQRPKLFTGVLVCIGYAVFFGFKAAENNDYLAMFPKYSGSVKPPVLGLVGGVSGDDYWAEVEQMLGDNKE